MYRLTGDAEYLRRARALGDALLRWLEPYGLISGSFNSCVGYEKALSEETATDNPVYYGEMTSFLLQLALQTGDARYRNAVFRYVERIVSRFPEVRPFGYSDNFTFSRYLMLLACLQSMTERDVSAQINGVLRFLSANQHPSGGFRETPIRLRDHAESGVGMGDGSDSIADLLYCNNFALAALSVLAHLDRPGTVDMEQAESLYRGLSRFVLNTQIIINSFDTMHHAFHTKGIDPGVPPLFIIQGLIGTTNMTT